MKKNNLLNKKNVFISFIFILFLMALPGCCFNECDKTIDKSNTESMIEIKNNKEQIILNDNQENLENLELDDK